MSQDFKQFPKIATTQKVKPSASFSKDLGPDGHIEMSPKTETSRDLLQEWMEEEFRRIMKPTNKLEGHDAGMQGDITAQKIFIELGGTKEPQKKKREKKIGVKSITEEDIANMPRVVQAVYHAWVKGEIPSTGVVGEQWRRVKEKNPKLQKKYDNALGRPGQKNVKLEWAKDTLEAWQESHERVLTTADTSDDYVEGKYKTFSRGLMDDGGDQCAFVNMKNVSKNCFSWLAAGKTFGHANKPYVKWCPQREAVVFLVLEEGASLRNTEAHTDKITYKKRKKEDTSEEEEDDAETEEDGKPQKKKAKKPKAREKAKRKGKPEDPAQVDPDKTLAAALAEAKRITVAAKSSLQNASDLMTQISDGNIDCSQCTLKKLRDLKEAVLKARGNPYFDYLMVHMQAPKTQITSKFSSKIILQAVKEGGTGDILKKASDALGAKITGVIAANEKLTAG